MEGAWPAIATIIAAAITALLAFVQRWRRDSQLDRSRQVRLILDGWARRVDDLEAENEDLRTQLVECRERDDEFDWKLREVRAQRRELEARSAEQANEIHRLRAELNALRGTGQ